MSALTSAPAPLWAGLTFPYPALPDRVDAAAALDYLRRFELQHRQWVTRLEKRINELAGGGVDGNVVSVEPGRNELVYDPAAQLTGWQIQTDGSIKLFVNGKERQHVAV